MLRLTALLLSKIHQPAVGVIPDAAGGAVLVVHPKHAHGTAGVDAVVQSHRRRDDGAPERPGLAVPPAAPARVVREELVGGSAGESRRRRARGARAAVDPVEPAAARVDGVVDGSGQVLLLQRGAGQSVGGVAVLDWNAAENAPS